MKCYSEKTIHQQNRSKIAVGTIRIGPGFRCKPKITQLYKKKTQEKPTRMFCVIVVFGAVESEFKSSFVPPRIHFWQMSPWWNTTIPICKGAQNIYSHSAIKRIYSLWACSASSSESELDSAGEQLRCLDLLPEQIWYKQSKRFGVGITVLWADSRLRYI